MKFYQTFCRYFIGILAVIIFSADSFAEVISAENTTYKVSFINTKEVNSTQVFQVFNKLTDEESTIAIMNLTQNVQQVHLVNDQMIVIGEVKDKEDGVVIHDLISNKEVDFILCRQPEISSDQQYLIYKKYYPSFLPKETQNDLLLVYDLSKLPQENRMNFVLGSNLSNTDVGYPIYPSMNVSKQSYSTYVGLPEKRDYIASKLLWLEDQKIVFVSKFENENWLVSVDWTIGLNNVDVTKSIIDLESIVKLKKDDVNYFSKLKVEKKLFSIKNLQKYIEGKVKLDLSGDERYTIPEITIEAPVR